MNLVPFCSRHFSAYEAMAMSERPDREISVWKPLMDKKGKEKKIHRLTLIQSHHSRKGIILASREAFLEKHIFFFLLETEQKESVAMAMAMAMEAFFCFFAVMN